MSSRRSRSTATSSERVAARRTRCACIARATPASAVSSSRARSRAPRAAGVRMNAGAYGRDWSDVLVRALVATADGEDWLSHGSSSGSRTGTRRSGRRTSSPRVEYELEPRAAGRDQGDGCGAGGAAQGHAADEQAHVRQRLQESGRRARRGEDARAVRPQGPPDRRRDDLSEARELHRERGRRDEWRLPRADGRGPPPRARGVRRRARARGRLRRRCPSSRRSRRSRPTARRIPPHGRGTECARFASAGAAASVVVPFPRGAAGARLDLVRFVPSGRSLVVSLAVLVVGWRRVLGRLLDVGVRGRAHRGPRRAAPASRARCRRRRATSSDRASSPSTRRRSKGRCAHCRRSRASRSIARFRTRSS